MPKEIATLFVFRSDSSNKQYQTLQYTDGTTSCECPGWKFKRASTGGERTCKHTRFIDAGMANQHAVNVVEYSVAAPVKRTPQRAMPEPTFTPGRRKFQLTD